MSRLSSLSPAAIKAMYASETDEQLIMLLTIYDPTTSAPFRLADGFTGRLLNLTTDSEVIYGVTSRTNDYVFLPMQISLPSEQNTGVGEFSVTLNFVSPEVVTLIRSNLIGPTKILLELILSNSPNTVEASFSNFYITNVSYNSESVTLNMSMISYNVEPFPSYNFTPSYFPGLF